MNLLIVAATRGEIAPLLDALDAKANTTSQSVNSQQGNIEVLITGVGATLTAYQLGKKLAAARPDLVINAGIAGALDSTIPIGAVLQITEDRFYDLCAEDATGKLLSLFDLGLLAPDDFPFENGVLVNPNPLSELNLPHAKAITVNRVHGHADSIRVVLDSTDAALESMEGAGVFYVCRMEGIPFVALRAVSNYVEPRNRANWNIPLAVTNLNQALFELLKLAGYEFTP